jgi:hypothetical protein
MLTMRVILWALVVSIVAPIYASVVHAAEDEVADRRETELRSAASSKDPAALRELGCFLYARGYTRSVADAKEAFELIRDAAIAGDDTASLYYSVYVRRGYRTEKNEDEADKIAMTLLKKIREGRSAQFPMAVAAAFEIQSSRCGFGDPMTYGLFLNADNICHNIKGEKPEWCG